MSNIEKNKIITSIRDNIGSLIKAVGEAEGIPQYAENPDFTDQRIARWHQFGLLRHTLYIQEVFLEEGQRIIQKEGLSELVNRRFAEDVGGLSKEVLFRVAMFFHDFGKISSYRATAKNRMHEQASEKLFEIGPVYDFISKFSLKESQIRLIKRYIVTHAAVGKEIRDELRHKCMFDLDTLKRKSEPYFKSVFERYKDVNIETGYFFLCDSLAKTSIRTKGYNGGVVPSNNEAIDEIKSNNVQEDILPAVIQLPLNIYLSKRYLDYCNNHPS